LNVHHQLVLSLRFLFHLHFFPRLVLGDLNKMNVLVARCVLVLQTLSALGVLDVKILHVLDGRDVQSLGVQDAPISTNSSVQDVLLFQDVPILMNPNELDARYENCLVLSCA
jgi:hypothetical protein